VEEDGERRLKSAKRPTAVLCSNDWTAIGALHAIDAAGLRVPGDISLVGFDDIPLARYTNPPVTSVRMSAGDVGSTAFDALFRLIGGERLEGDIDQVPTKLVVRASTFKPKRSSA
jgi:DNA-binding LacI/PurR family transcriptional regulator